MYSKDEKLKKVQMTVLQMSQIIYDFCKKNEIVCYFCGGGVIGAIREGGFIPWDDDLDFFMPRKDYERFYKIWKQSSLNDRYPILRTNESYVDHNLFTTIRDSNTTFIKTYQADLDLPHGIAIDIFPLDVAPESAFEKKIQKIWALIYSLYCNQIVPKNHGGVIATGSKILLQLVPNSKTRYQIWKYAEKQMTKYNDAPTGFVTELCVGPRYMGNIYKAEDFSSSIEKPFEDKMMPIPVGYNRYLSEVFGNYMQRPPKDKQVSIHDAVFIDPDNSYKNYKGIYYLTNKEDK
ncbi:LicD family protein [Enterococcus gilvus]|uniref:LicD family protein n=1 Tax=Enterococcus gilvus TaxID=160453 RepID=UPI003D6C092F